MDLKQTEYIREKVTGSHDFVPTIGGRGQRHLHGLVGKFWRIKNPESVRIGDCFLTGRLKKGDVFLCTKHSGDCFQTYTYVEIGESWDGTRIGIKSLNNIEFGSYGIGDAEEEKYNITDNDFNILKSGGYVEIFQPNNN